MAGFFGMRSTSDWEEGERPKSWREGILRIFPNGSAPLTAILSLAKKERKDDYEFNWFTKSVPEQRGSFTAGSIYTDQALSSAYASGGTAGDVLYVKVSAAVASEFRPGHKALLRVSSDLNADVVAKVVASVQNGSSSYVAVKLLEDDDNSSSHDLSDADTIKVIGNINPQGGVTPTAISYNPTKYTNYMNIFRTPLEITRTALRTKFRTGDKYKEMKREALELHSIEMEWSFLLSVAYEGIGDNGQPEYCGDGLITFLRKNLSSHILDYVSDSDYAGDTWLEGGDQWLLEAFEVLTRYDTGDSGEFLILAGSGALMGLELLARQGTHMNINAAQNVGYGMRLRSLVNSFGEFPIKTHPLFSMEETMRHSMLILKPKNIVYAYIDDTQFYGNNGKPYGYTSSGKRVDGLNEEFLTECGLEYHSPYTAMFLTGVGKDNTVGT